MTCSLIGFQLKKHSQVMAFRTVNEICFALNYLCLGGYTGAALNVVGSIRNLTFASLVKKGKSTVIYRFIFSFIFLVFGFFTWTGFPTLIFCVGKLTTTFVYGSKNLTFVRIMTVVTSCMWICYNLSVGAYEAIVSDVVCIVSALSALIRIDIIEARKKRPSEQSDVIAKASEEE